jgi:hypothetical protein
MPWLAALLLGDTIDTPFPAGPGLDGGSKKSKIVPLKVQFHPLH